MRSVTVALLVSGATVTLRKHVEVPGRYRVGVTVLPSRAAARNRVLVAIGRTRETVTTRHRRAKLWVDVRVAGTTLTIRAVGRRPRLRVVVSIRRLPSRRKAADPVATAPTPNTAVASPPVAATPTPTVTAGPPPPPIAAWLPANSVSFTPLSDQAAAAAVIAAPENRLANATANADMPTPAQLQAFYAAKDLWGRSVVAFNPYYYYVTGRYAGTTDDIIQWAAWKWGIPEDWLRAQYVQESRWKQSQLGDLVTVSASVYGLYPAQARVAGSLRVYQSMGISQIKWSPDGRYGAGTEPMRWQSTAFNADYEAATIRFYFDDPHGLRTIWGDPTYRSGQTWNSLAGWYTSFPWNTAAQLQYIGTVQHQLAMRPWTAPGF